MLSNRRHNTVLGVALGLLAACLFALLAVPVAASILTHNLARAMLPPVYPGSTLARDTGLLRAMHMGSEGREYLTGDSVKIVIDYMEQYMPPFASPSGMGCYQSEKSVPGPDWQDYIPHRGYLPTPAVYVQLCPGRGGGTQIAVQAVWPEVGYAPPPY